MDDYALTMPVGLFQTGDTRACTSITLLTNTRVEGTEYLTVNLIGNSEVIVNSAATSATVIIVDDDGKLHHSTVRLEVAFCILVKYRFMTFCFLAWLLFNNPTLHDQSRAIFIVYN